MKRATTWSPFFLYCEILSGYSVEKYRLSIQSIWFTQFNGIYLANVLLSSRKSFMEIKLYVLSNFCNRLIVCLMKIARLLELINFQNK